MLFKLYFPTGYQVKNEFDDNLDVQVILNDGKVYYATLFTLTNIEALMKKDAKYYFKAADMLIVRDLKHDTIKKAIKNLFEDTSLEYYLSYIGTETEVFGNQILDRDFIIVN